MAESLTARAWHALALGGFLFALAFYLPPTGPLAEFIYHHPLPLRFVGAGASFLFTALAILLVIVALVLLVFLYGEDCFAVDVYLMAKNILDRKGLGGFDRFGLGLAIACVIILPFVSFHYWPFGVALTIAFVGLLKAPDQAVEMGALPRQIAARPLPGGNFSLRSYAWDFDYDLGEETPVKKAQFLELNLDLDAYNAHQAKNPSRQRHPGPGDLAELVGRGVTPEVELTAARIRQTTTEDRLCSFLEVLNAISFVQSPNSIPYKTDKETTGIDEYWRYPLETLADQAGDCECKTILAAAIFRVLGTQALFLLYPPKENQPGHIALAIQGGDSFPPGLQFFPYQGKKYFYCELTGAGMRPGEVPEVLKQTVPVVYAV